VSQYPALASPVPKQRAQAFTELVKATTSREVSILRYNQHLLSEHLLEEIAGKAFLTLWKKIESDAVGWKEKWTWDYFRGVLRRLGVNEFKKRDMAGRRFGKHQRKVVTTADDLEIYGAAQPRFAEREMQANALRAMDAAIAKLPVQQRRVAEILRDNRDAKVGPKEIIELYRKAHGATLTPAAAKSSMSVVRTKLRAALAQVSVE
jgi:DNA-directed RNA polymerase specialized sigma24 family protein